MASSTTTNTTSSDLVVYAGDNNGGGDDAETKASAYRGDPEAILKHLASFPPGYRFAPSEHELIEYYLCKRQAGCRLPINNIIETDIYKYDPQQLAAKYFERSYDERSYEKSWYFFTPRDRKYPNGVRPNRSAGGGYWKATGKDKKILNSNTKKVGCKKALVFYMGEHGKGVKTNWIMHEYRTEDVTRQKESPEDMKLDDCVLVRIHEKTTKEENGNVEEKAKPKRKVLLKKNKRKSSHTSTDHDHDVSSHSHTSTPKSEPVVNNVSPVSSTDHQLAFLNDFERLESMGLFYNETGIETGQNQLSFDPWQNGMYPEHHQLLLPTPMPLSHRIVAPVPTPLGNGQGTLESIPGSFVLGHPTQVDVMEKCYETTIEQLMMEEEARVRGTRHIVDSNVQWK